MQENKSWNHLLQTYYNTINMTSGCGSRGQIYVDQAYNNLVEFCYNHSEFKSQLPKKHKCQDDKINGSFGTIEALHSQFKY